MMATKAGFNSILHLALIFISINPLDVCTQGLLLGISGQKQPRKTDIHKKVFGEIRVFLFASQVYALKP